MSIHDDMQASSDSFWEIGKYSKTVKRCDNGYKLCDSLRSLINERAEIEKGYSKKLLEWTKNWNNYLDKGPEYGTTQSMWRGLLEEANSTADLHTMIAENLIQKVYQSIKQWQKENYHKSMMHFKETKEFEDNFKKAQKPWEKKYNKVQACRKDYHNACKAEKSTANQVNNVKNDDSVAIDSKKKMEERLQKCQQEVANLKEKYEAALNDINNYNAKYIEDMTEVFNKSQEFERKRIDFFKSTFYELHQCLDLSVDPRFPQIYTDLHNTIGKTDADQDLRWWSYNSGVEMAMNWPQFDEYSPDLRKISNKASTQFSSNDGITITSIRHKGDFPTQSDNSGTYNRQSTRSNDSDAQTNTRKNSIGLILPRNPAVAPPKPHRSPSLSKHEDRTIPEGAPSPLVKAETRPMPEGQNRSPPTPAKRTHVRNPSSSDVQKQVSVEYDEALNPFGDEDEDDNVNAAIDDEKNQSQRSTSSYEQPRNDPEPTPTYNGQTTQEPENPFGEDSDESPKESPRLADPVLVRAVFDYDAVEPDELTFKAGEEFYKLSEEDELGWCKGLKDGIEKLYPANYVKPVSELG